MTFHWQDDLQQYMLHVKDDFKVSKFKTHMFHIKVYSYKAALNVQAKRWFKKTCESDRTNGFARFSLF